MWIIQDVFSEENADDMLWIFCKGKSHDLIYLFKLTTAIEWKSSKLKQLHAHVLIFLTYARDCKLHVAYDRLRASIANALGMPIHFEGKLLDNKQMLEQMQQNQINYVLKEYLGINRNKEK